MRPLKNSNGQGLIEYLIIVTIMAVAALSIMRTVSQNVAANFADVAYALQGKKQSARRDDVEASQFKKRDLSDFFDGAASGAK